MYFTCRKLKCKHNKDLACTLKDVTIDKKLNCEMYDSSGEKTDDLTKTMFDKTPEFDTFKHNKQIKICCKAPCIFNKQSKCLANGIMVNTTANCPAKCFTYLKK